jgi:hypothetical protein
MIFSIAASFTAPSPAYHLPLLLRRPRTIRINTTFDLRQALLMRMHHLDDRDHTASHNRYDRHQQTAQRKESIDDMFHVSPPHERYLVELTGIEPVASWLQTRRSPS